MPKIKLEQLQRHLKTHSERSNDDRNAISVLQNFLRSDGKINHKFECNDKWPNIDGSFEFVPDPQKSRKPKQNFIAQIKGTTNVRYDKKSSFK